MCVVLLFCAIGIFSQEKFSKEISFVTENDLYTSTYDDRYYTNGMFLSYSYLSKIQPKELEKRIFEWQVGHKMYTPSNAITLDINKHDRPFAGYLFSSFSIHNIYKNNSSFKTTLQLGVLGKNAFSEELQDFIHDLYNFKKAIGWKYQIKNALGLNLNAAYNQLLSKNKKTNLDVFWVNYGKIGTVHTALSTGFLARFGFKPLQALANSLAFKTHLNSRNTKYFSAVESFLFIKPTVKYTLYDATLQGSFLNRNSVVTNEIEPLIFAVSVGFKFTTNRFNFGYTYNYNTNASKGLDYNNGHTFGSIHLNYLLK